MICDSSISDGGWGAACYNGMTAGAATRGWETAYTDSIEQSAYADTMISYCDLGYDLILRGTEITPGAQREHRYEQLRKQADEKGLGEDVKFYMDFFRYGCPPHGGFGLGVDRLTMLLLGLSIKEVMFLFRGPHRIPP
jgi:aspartyl-tRNA synthetase